MQNRRTAKSFHRRARAPRWLLLSLPLLPWPLLALGACDSGAGRTPQITVSAFSPVTTMDVLTQAEAEAIIRAAAEAIDAPNMAVAVTDRIGNILRVWNRQPGSQQSDCDNRTAVSLARTAAYLSHSQAPLTTRTGQFISTSHFPPVFGSTFTAMGAGCVPVQPTLGVQNTPQGPLWQIDASNRGAPVASMLTNPPTMYDAGKEIPRLTNSDGSAPSPGLTPLPGGVPLYKRTLASLAGMPSAVGRRLVGGVGVYVTQNGVAVPEAAEFAAFQGSLTINPITSEDYTFGPIPNEGAVYLVGVLLPYLGSGARPPGFGPGVYEPANTVFASMTSGMPDPEDWLISPRDSASGVTFTAAEVQTIVLACRDAALATHAAIRLPATAPCQMIISVTDVDGVILGLFRMTDATLFSLEISLTKARNSVYYSSPTSVDASGPRAGQHPLAGIVPPGTAITCRTLGFLSQPSFPPTIDGNPPGPLFELAVANRDPARFNAMGFAPPAMNDTQSGIIFFPGSAPLYRNGVLIGGIGVSGDGVEQDDVVTAAGIRAAQRALGFQLEPPAAIRCDNFTFRGARLPYWKFPKNPGG